MSMPKYNSTLTYLRLGIDGGLRAYTFYDKVDYGAWERPSPFFVELPMKNANYRRDVEILDLVRTANVLPAYLQMGYSAGARVVGLLS